MLDFARYAPDPAALGDWKPDGLTGWTHPDGWAIGLYSVSGKPVFLLWEGRSVRGRFESWEAARTAKQTVGAAPVGKPAAASA